jgi:hypothetical protein
MLLTLIVIKSEPKVNHLVKFKPLIPLSESFVSTQNKITPYFFFLTKRQKYISRQINLVFFSTTNFQRFLTNEKKKMKK